MVQKFNNQEDIKRDICIFKDVDKYSKEDILAIQVS